MEAWYRDEEDRREGTEIMFVLGRKSDLSWRWGGEDVGRSGRS
jgi:hypothetical protein